MATLLIFWTLSLNSSSLQKVQFKSMAACERAIDRLMENKTLRGERFYTCVANQ